MRRCNACKLDGVYRYWKILEGMGLDGKELELWPGAGIGYTWEDETCEGH